MSARPRVLALVGPTGTGKTEVAAEVARRCGGEVISADSMQVYRGMDIGTAKPDASLLAEVRHHLIDVVEPDDPMTAGRYVTLARAAAREASQRGAPLILCGGTGLYARAFAGGLVPRAEPSPQLRAALRARPLDALYAELRAVDPEAAARIHPADRVRIERALEIQRSAGRPPSDLRGEHAFGDRPFDVIWLGLQASSESLWPRLQRRIDAMFRKGWVEEVRALLDAGHSSELPSMRAIGYREICAMIRGDLDEASARMRIAVGTRRYAKRQRTWFRAEPGVQWCAAEDREGVIAAALRALDPPSPRPGRASA